MRCLLIICIICVIWLNVVKSCTGPPPIPPPRYWVEREPNPPSGLPRGIYFWVGLEVVPFQGSSWPPICACAIKFPSCISRIVAFKLTWTNLATHQNINVNFPLKENNETREKIERLQGADTIGGSGRWVAFSGAVSQSSIQQPSLPGPWVLKIWFLICTPFSLQCPWVIFGAGGLNNLGQFVVGHEFKFMYPYDPSIGGDPVINTFDGLRYEFQGLCSYILSMDCNEKFITDKKHFDMFKVVGVNKPCDLGSCLGSAIIYVKDSHGNDVRIDFLSGFKTLVNGTQIDLTNENEYVFDGGKLSVALEDYTTAETSGAAIDVSFLTMFTNVSQEVIRLDTDSKIAFTWNGIDNLRFDTKQLDMTSINTCGLLGDFDGDMKNDMRYPDGSIIPILPTETLDDLEESWIVQSFAHQWIDRQPQDPVNCKSSTPRRLCDGNKSRKMLSESICKGFIKSYEMHPKCNIKENQSRSLYTQCVHDMCFCYNDDIFACARYLYHALEARCH